MPGAVQLSAAAWEALRLSPDDGNCFGDGDAQLPPAVERDIKGKGRLRTFTVHAATPVAARLRLLVDAPWPEGDDGDSTPVAGGRRPSLGKPPRAPAQMLD